jgi:hypothetical protein
MTLMITPSSIGKVPGKENGDEMINKRRDDTDRRLEY